MAPKLSFRRNAMRRTAILIALGTSASLIALAGCSKTKDNVALTDGAQQASYLPDANRTYPTRVLWGDEHVHTGWSVDAGLAGATLTPDDAVRFARGEQVKSSSGQPGRLSRPLDS